MEQYSRLRRQRILEIQSRLKSFGKLTFFLELWLEVELYFFHIT